MTGDLSRRDLARVDDPPAVTLLCPLDRRRPGHAGNRAALDGLVATAREALAAVPGADAASTDRRLAAAVDGWDFDHPRAGVAILVSPHHGYVIGLATGPAPEVAVGPHFALSGLIAAERRTPRARVLVCSRAATRCVEIADGRAHERIDDRFPVLVSAPTESDTPHRDFPLDEHESAEAARFVFRAVRRALEPIERAEPAPLVLVGAERDLAYLAEVGNGHLVPTARITGNHVRATPEAIAALVGPALAERTRCDDVALCTRVRETLGVRAVGGIDAVWDAAREGRVHRLLVESEIRTGKQVGPAGLTGVGAAPAALDAAENAVVEALRHGSEVVVVAPGSLTDLGGIAATTRY